MKVKENILVLMAFVCAANAYETIQCADVLENHSSTEDKYLDVTQLKGFAAANLTNCIEQWQVVKRCEESQHTKWIYCNISATKSRGDSSGSTPSTYLRSDTLHLPPSIKPSTEAPNYFNVALDEESDIFGDNFHLAEEPLDEDALFNSMGELTEDEEDGATTLEPDTSPSTSTTSTSTTSTSTTPTPTTVTPITPTDSTVRTSRLPRTTPETSGAESTSTVWNMLVLYIGLGLFILW